MHDGRAFYVLGPPPEEQHLFLAVVVPAADADRVRAVGLRSLKHLTV